MQIDLSQYDFLDFGCSAGASLRNELFGGKRGLGLDSNPDKVEKARAEGVEAEVADITKLNPKELGKVRFVKMVHFLEHLPGRQAARDCIKSACQLAREFVFIRQPYFDADGYLFSLGLKLYWSDWNGHPYNMTSLDLHNMLSRLQKHTSLITRFIIFFKYEIKDSSATFLHPISSPGDQHHWDSEVHDPKPEVEFTFPVFREAGAVILTGSMEMNEGLSRFLKSCRVVFDSKIINQP
ncbi:MULTISPECIES: class I SAM-dependent methyltransferase [unclassified Nitrospina]|uniref:class I SAM-dependent methyltransferase n=1 Tax=unclassified Nitrospina TaxID=2638683 RepID=UPI003F96BEF7